MTPPKPQPQEMWAVMREDGFIHSAHWRYLTVQHMLSQESKTSVLPLLTVRVRVEVIDE